MQRLTPSPRLRAHLERYNQSHLTPVNRALHFVGIPLLVVSTLGLLAKVPRKGQGDARPQPDAAWPALLGAAAWYLRQDWRAGLPLAAGSLACYAVGRRLPARLLAALFGAGAVAHTVGHYGFEHKPPAFLSHPEALLEAPPWLLATWAGWHAQAGRSTVAVH